MWALFCCFASEGSCRDEGIEIQEQDHQKCGFEKSEIQRGTALVLLGAGFQSFGHVYGDKRTFCGKWLEELQLLRIVLYRAVFIYGNI